MQRIPSTWMEIPAAAFGSRATLELYPVSLSSLDSGYYVSNKAQKYVKHGQIVRSTPFQCAVTAADDRLNRFPLNVTVWATGDKQKFAEPGESPLVVAPCEWRGKWELDLTLVNPSSPLCKLLSGNLSVGQQDFGLEINPDGDNGCETVDLQGDELVIESQDDISSCLCYNITEVGEMNTQEGIEEGQRFCMGFVRLNNILRALYNTDVSNMGVCPDLDNPTQLREGRRVLVLLSNEENVCATEGKAGEVRPNDVCLGYLKGRRWDCLQGYYERVESPTWEPQSGQRSYVYQGRLTSCDPGATYAFLSIPLPPEPQPINTEPSFW